MKDALIHLAVSFIAACLGVLTVQLLTGQRFSAYEVMILILVIDTWARVYKRAS